MRYETWWKSGLCSVVMRIDSRYGIGTSMTTPPDVWSALATSGLTKGAPSLPSTRSCSGASTTFSPSSSMVMRPVLVTSPSSRVNQMAPISPAPACSAMTQPAAVVRRQEYLPSVPALSTSISPSSPASATRARKTASAIGERQMLPVQTKQTRKGGGRGRSLVRMRSILPQPGRWRPVPVAGS